MSVYGTSGIARGGLLDSYRRAADLDSITGNQYHRILKRFIPNPRGICRTTVLRQHFSIQRRQSQMLSRDRTGMQHYVIGRVATYGKAGLGERNAHLYAWASHDNKIRGLPCWGFCLHIHGSKVDGVIGISIRLPAVTWRRDRPSAIIIGTHLDLVVYLVQLDGIERIARPGGLG